MEPKTIRPPPKPLSGAIISVVGDTVDVTVGVQDGLTTVLVGDTKVGPGGADVSFGTNCFAGIEVEVKDCGAPPQEAIKSDKINKTIKEYRVFTPDNHRPVLMRLYKIL